MRFLQVEDSKQGSISDKFNFCPLLCIVIKLIKSLFSNTDQHFTSILHQHADGVARYCCITCEMAEIFAKISPKHIRRQVAGYKAQALMEFIIHPCNYLKSGLILLMRDYVELFRNNTRSVCL